MTSQYESGQDSAFDEGFDPLFREDAFFAGAKQTDSLQPEAPLQSKPGGCHPIRWYELPHPVRHFLQRPEHRRFCWQASAQTARTWQQASPSEHRLFIAWDGVRAEPVTQYRQGLHSHRSVYAFRTDLPAQSTAVGSGSGTADKSVSCPPVSAAALPLKGVLSTMPRCASFSLNPAPNCAWNSAPFAKPVNVTVWRPMKAGGTWRLNSMVCPTPRRWPT